MRPHTTSVARLAAGQVDVMVSYGHIRIKNAPIWESDFGGTAPMVEQTGVIGVTDGIYNDMIAYSKTSDTMADEAFRQAVGESFIELAQTEEGQEIFGVFSQVGYDWGSDSDYDGAGGPGAFEIYGSVTIFRRDFMLQAIHIRKQFQRSGEVLRDVSFTLGDGEFLSVIGPSGAGKPPCSAS